MRHASIMLSYSTDNTTAHSYTADMWHEYCAHTSDTVSACHTRDIQATWLQEAGHYIPWLYI